MPGHTTFLLASKKERAEAVQAEDGVRCWMQYRFRLPISSVQPSVKKSYLPNQKSCLSVLYPAENIVLIFAKDALYPLVLYNFHFESLLPLCQVYRIMLQLQSIQFKSNPPPATSISYVGETRPRARVTHCAVRPRLQSPLPLGFCSLLGGKAECASGLHRVCPVRLQRRVIGASVGPMFFELYLHCSRPDLIFAAA